MTIASESTRRRARLFVALAGLLLVPACRDSNVTRASQVRGDAPPLTPYLGASDIAAFVRDQREAAAREGKSALVYVGASWCPSCRAFKAAHRDGRLDALAQVHFLEFDFDRHGEALVEAGYMDEYLPFFVIPDARGRGSEHRVVGAAPGDPGLRALVGQLGELVAAARSSETSGRPPAP